VEGGAISSNPAATASSPRPSWKYSGNNRPAPNIAALANTAVAPAAAKLGIRNSRRSSTGWLPRRLRTLAAAVAAFLNGYAAVSDLTLSGAAAAG
jgi:hypothetical protein